MKTIGLLLKYSYVLVVFICIGSIFAQGAGAFTMSNSNYILETGNFNTVSGKSGGSGKELRMSAGQTAQGLYTGTNYKVCAGFLCIRSTIQFSFSIDQTSIDFGLLSPTNPVTRTNTLAVSNDATNGYSVTAYEDHELLVSSTGAKIPDTTCDDGSCNKTTSAVWTNILTYGFGYRCDNVSGSDCASGFTDTNNYKRFANISDSETAESVMKGTNKGRNKQVKITYKVNISNMQAAGLYSNVITYIATPTY